MKRIRSPRSLIGSTVFGVVAMWFAGWLGKYATMIPAYIFRGLYKTLDDTRSDIERLILGVGGVLITALLLLLYYSRTDTSERMDIRRAWKESALSAGVYAVLQFLSGILLRNNQLVAHSSYFLSTLFGTYRDPLYPTNVPTALSHLLGACLSSALYMGVAVLGVWLAIKRRRREIEHMKREQ